MSKTIVVFGAGGFIGGHLCRKLSSEGHTVIGVDIKRNEYWNHEKPIEYYSSNSLDGHFYRFYLLDLRNPNSVNQVISLWTPDELYQLAADMGGAGYIFSGEHDADVMHNSALINLNTLDAIKNYSRKTKVFYSSSACIYPEHNQTDPLNPNCEESSAYPAMPDSEYGWEKLFSERLYMSYARNYGINVRIARFHNVFGPQGAWNNGKEKSPAALCRKVSEANSGGVVEVWGTGEQTRSFLYIDECLDGVQRLMDSDVKEVLNIGSDEMISINNLVLMVANIAGKKILIKNIDGPLGVMGRRSDNRMIKEKLGWAPSMPLVNGMRVLYEWIDKQKTQKR